MRRNVIFFVMITLFLMIIATSAAFAQAETVNIAVLATISGDLSEVGILGQRGAEMAVEHINAEGGIKALGGAKINLVVGDVTSDYSNSINVAQRLLGQHNLSGIVIAGVSGMNKAVAPVLEKAEVPFITGAIADDLTNLGYKYIFRICPKGSAFGHMQVEFSQYLLEEKGGTSKVGIIYENTAYGESTAGGVAGLCEEYGIPVAIEESYPKDFTDATPLVSKLKSSGAEVLFPVSYTKDAALIFGTMQSMGYNPMIIGGGAGFIWPEFYKTLGSLANGVSSVGSWVWDTKNIVDNPDLVAVTEEWEEKYGDFMGEMAGEMYAAVYCLKEAMEECGSSDPKEVRNALAEIKITEGRATLMQPGIVEFAEDGNNIHVRPVMGQWWEDGKLHSVYPREFTNNEIKEF